MLIQGRQVPQGFVNLKATDLIGLCPELDECRDDTARREPCHEAVDFILDDCLHRSDLGLSPQQVGRYNTHEVVDIVEVDSWHRGNLRIDIAWNSQVDEEQRASGACDHGGTHMLTVN